jgi:hypothetical protein
LPQKESPPEKSGDTTQPHQTLPEKPYCNQPELATTRIKLLSKAFVELFIILWMQTVTKFARFLSKLFTVYGVIVLLFSSLSSSLACASDERNSKQDSESSDFLTERFHSISFFVWI